MGRKYIKDLPLILSPSFDGYFIYDNGTTTYKGTINGLYDKFYGTTTSYYDFRYVNITGDTIYGDMFIYGKTHIYDRLTVQGGDITIIGGTLGDYIDPISRGYFSELSVSNGISGLTMYSDSFIKNGGTGGQFLMADGSVTTTGDTISLFKDAYVNITGDTMSGMLTLNNGLNLEGYTRLYGDETGLFIKNNDNTDFDNITTKTFIKNGGTGDQYLMADGSVTTTGDTISLFNGAYVNITGGTMTGELTINNNLNLNGALIQFGDTYVTGMVQIEGRLDVYGDIGDNIDLVSHGYFNNLYGNFISGETIYSSGDLDITGNVSISGFTDMYDTLYIHNADLLIGGYLGYETEPVPHGYFNEIVAFSGITGETIHSDSFVKTGGAYNEYLMADGSVTTTGPTALSVVKNYGLTNKIVIINEIQPNTLYIYDASVISSLTISAKASSWGDSSISHVKFTSDSTISIIYTSDIFIKFNSDTTPQSNKAHEISLFGNDAILAVKD